MRSYLRILIGMVALSFIQPALAQVPGLGFNPEGVFQHGDIDSVNLENLNATIQIPLFSYPQRGSVGTINFNLYANTNIWGPTYVPNGGSVPTGNYEVNYSSLGPSINIPQLATVAEVDNFYLGSSDGQQRLQATWSVQEADGGIHTFVVDANSIAYPNTQSNASYRTADGSGYAMLPGVGFVDGQGRNRLAIGSDGWQHQGLVDTDGNTVSSTGSRWIWAPSIVDTVGRSIPDPNAFFFPNPPTELSSRCPTNIQDDTQKLQASVPWNVPGINGGTVTYLICFAYINIRTNFWQNSGNNRTEYYCEGDEGEGCGGAWNWEEQQGPGYPVIQSIVLPDGTYWGFRYDSVDEREVMASPPSGYPHPCTNDLSVGPASHCAYGVITQIIEPTGGTITYDYALQADGTFNAEPNEAYLPYITKRTVSSGSGTPMVWKYSTDTSGASLYGGSKVTDPANNDMVVGYSGAISTTFPTYTKSQIWYDGAVGGTVKKRTDSTYTKIFNPAPYDYPGYYSAIADQLNDTTTTVDGIAISKEYTQYALQFFGTAMQCGWNPTTTVYDVCDHGNGSQSLYMGIPAGSVIKDGAGSTTYKSSYSFPIAAYGSGYCTNGGTISDYWNHNFLTQPAYTTTDDGTNTLRTNYCYDESGHTVSSSSLGSPGTLGLGHVTTVSSKSGVDTHSYWTKYGLLDHVVDPAGHTAATFQYDSSTTGSYAKALAPTSVATSIGTESYSYDYNTGLALSHTDVNSKTTNYAYDAMQRPWNVQNPDVSSGYSAVACYSSNSVTVYKAQGSSALSRPSSSSSCPASSSALISTQNVDGLGRTISSVVYAPEGNIQTDTSYDVMGRVATVSTPHYAGSGANSWTVNSYDSISRPSSVNVGTTSLSTLNGDSRSWSYGGLSTTVTDGRSNQTTTVVDPVGRVVDVYEPTAPSTSPTLRTHYTYNIYGLSQVFQCGTSSLSACTSASTSRTRTFAYDGMGRLTSAANPETGTVSYYYLDASGNPCAGDPSLPCRKIDARGVEQRFAYDTANRLTAKTYPGVSTNVVSCYRYDTVTNGTGQLGDEWTQIGGSCSGNPSAAASTSQLVTQHSILAYDPMGRVTQEKRCAMGVCSSGAPVINYNYDLAGNVTAYNNGISSGASGATSFANQYDSAGRLTAVTSSWNDSTHPGLLFSAQGFGAYGLSNAALGNHLNLTKIYDQQMRVKEQTVLAH